MDSAVNDSTTSPEERRGRGRVWLCLVAPLVAVVVVAGGFLLGQRVLPEQWVIHVDGRGNISFGSWWPLFVGVMVVVGLAFVLGQYLFRDFRNLGHWYFQQKGIVVGCFALGYAVLGLLVGKLLAAWRPGEDSTVEAGMGYGLLSFVVVATVAAILYWLLLPKAELIR